MATKRYTQRELEIFVRCWQTATNLEGLVAALKDHPEHRTITYEWDVTRWPQAGCRKLFTDSEKTELESKGFRIRNRYSTLGMDGEEVRIVYEAAEKTKSQEVNVEWAKRRASKLRRKGIRLKKLGSVRRSSGVNYASLSAVASEYR